jgi:hypothetical protein
MVGGGGGAEGRTHVEISAALIFSRDGGTENDLAKTGDMVRLWFVLGGVLISFTFLPDLRGSVLGTKPENDGYFKGWAVLRDMLETL